MSDFNSSDIEMEPTTKPFANVDQQSIVDMLEHATADRALSKIFVKQLQDLRGDRKAQSDRARWAARFEAFYKDTLKMKVEQCPTSLHIIHFPETIMSKVKPKAHDVPTFSWTKSSIYHLTKALIFRYLDFSCPHTTVHVLKPLSTLLEEKDFSLKSRHGTISGLVW